MSLKNIAGKIIACFIAIYMVLGNIMMTGIEMSKVIAEEANIPQITLLSELQKYVQYSNELGKGAVIQTKLSLGEESSKETHKNISKTEIQIDAPKIDGILPERVNIIAANTKLTNGKEEGEINQNYNKETGLLNIFYENQANYQDYIENAKDEFEIIYIYPQLAYKASEEKINVEIKGEVKREYRLENSTVSNNKVQIDRFELSKNIGEIVNYEVICTSDIYKGYLYANEENKTNYETEYKNTAEFSVLNNDVTEQTKLILGKTSFIDKENKETATDAVVYKSSKISEKEFNKMFGQDGWVNFYIGNTKYATINYSEADKDGNRTYQTYYHVEGIENNEAGKVVYPEGTLEVIIETSKPQTEGTLSIENEKVIKAKEDYGIKVEDIVKLKEITKIEENKNYIVEEDKKDEEGQVVTDENGNIQKQQVEKTATVVARENKALVNLKEPTTQMSLDLSSNNLSTLSDNQITATIKLNDTNSSCRLFSAGTIEITLPNNIASSKILNAQALYTNGLVVKSAKIENGKVILNVEGNQTSYDIENISGGVNIILELELDIEDIVPTHKETLVLTYAQEKVIKDINIVSKSGLLVFNKIETNKGQEIVSIDNSEKELKIEHNDQKQTLKQTINLVNNYNQDLTEVEVVGQIGYQKEENKRFDIQFIEEIKSIGIESEVYYSTEYEGNVWSKHYNKEAKAYKIIIKNMKAGSNAIIDLNLLLQDNIDYNKETYLTTNVKYTYETNELEQQTNMKIATETKIEDATKLIVEEEKNLEIKFTTEFNPNAIYGENTNITYYANIENITDKTIKDVKIKDILPKELGYVEAYIVNNNVLDNYEENKGKEAKYDDTTKTVVWDLGNIDAKENKIIILKVKINNIKEGISTISNKIVTSINGVDKYESNQNIYVEKAEIDVELKSLSDKMVKEGESIVYDLIIRNKTEVDSTVKISDTFNEGIMLKKIIYYVGSTESKEDVQFYNSQNFDTEVILEGKKEKRIQLECVATKIEEGIEQKEIENFVTIQYENIEKKSNALKHIIIKNPDLDKDDIVNDDTTNGDNNQNNTNEDNKNENNNNNQEESKKYTISGVAWLDINKNGKKDESETLLKGINVTLINSQKGEFVKDSNGNIIKTITDNNGVYRFDNLEVGTYLVMFEFDINKYKITAYQKEGILNKENSDAIMTNTTLENKIKLVGITDKLEIVNKNLENIDIGLIENAIFDLNLDKQISSITVVNSQGSKTTEYKNKNFAKIDLVAKYMNNTNVIISYKFVITNNGDVTGYVDKLVDNLPTGLEFSSELNKDWYKGADGNLYTKSLNGIAIKPGEATEVELILTKKTTENTTGTFTNNAEILQISNLEAIEENTEAKQNNKSSADVVISIKTGSAIMYIGITAMCLVVIAIGAYIIKKKILNRGI